MLNRPRFSCTTRLASAAAFLLLVLQGCAPRSLSPLNITVLSTDSNIPIAGAKVVADTPSFKHPFSVTAALLGRDAPESHIAYTDSRGRAMVEYLTGHPVRIGVLARGHALLIRNIDEPWTGVQELATEPGEPGAALRVQVEPGDDGPPHP